MPTKSRRGVGLNKGCTKLNRRSGNLRINGLVPEALVTWSTRVTCQCRPRDLVDPSVPQASQRHMSLNNDQNAATMA